MGSSANLTQRETALVEQLFGQRAAFLRFLGSKVGSTAAEDILQTSYLKLVEKGPQIAVKPNLKPRAKPL